MSRFLQHMMRLLVGQFRRRKRCLDGNVGGKVRHFSKEQTPRARTSDIVTSTSNLCSRGKIYTLERVLPRCSETALLQIRREESFVRSRTKSARLVHATSEHGCSVQCSPWLGRAIVLKRRDVQQRKQIPERPGSWHSDRRTSNVSYAYGNR